MNAAQQLLRARRIAIAGMVVSGLLAVLKIVAGWRGHSASVLADGMESAADVFASGMVLAGLILSTRPADLNHPYGHGRIEILTGLMLGFSLFVAGGLISYSAWASLGVVSHAPEPWTLIPMLISIVAKGILTGVKHRQARAIGSSSLMADAANDAVDMLSGVVALGSLSLALWRPDSFAAADHWGAFAVGLIVMFTALRLVREAALHLMDTMPDDEAVREIRETALAMPGVMGVEKCYARKTGLQYHVDLHLEVNPEITVRESHEIAQDVRYGIRRKLTWVADVLVHVEPWPGE